MFFAVWSDHHVRAVVKIKAEGLVAELDIGGTEGNGKVSFQFKRLNTSVSNVTLAIHELPPSYHSRCTPENVGKIYDPTDAQMAANYENRCANSSTACAIGDLRGRIGEHMHTCRYMVIAYTFYSVLFRSNRRYDSYVYCISQ